MLRRLCHIVAAKGRGKVSGAMAAIAEAAGLPLVARGVVAQPGRQTDHLDGEIAHIEDALMAQHKANPISRLLAGSPGIGPITALTLALRADPTQFRSIRVVSHAVV